MARRLHTTAAALALLLTIAGCARPDCCGPDLPLAYGRVYGVVKSASQVPLADIIVQVEGSSGTKTDSAGHYALGLTVRAIDGSVLHLPVRAVRTNLSGAVVDSTIVQAQIPVYVRQPVSDSALVNISYPTP